MQQIAMQKTVVGLSVLSLVGAGYAVFTTLPPAAGAKRPGEGTTAVEMRVDALTARVNEAIRRLEALERQPAPLSPREASAPAATAPGPGLAPASSPSAATARVPDKGTAAPPTIEDLAARVSAIEEARKNDEKAGTVRFARGPGAGPFLTSTDSAQKELDLTDGQKAEWDRIVGDARRDMDALRKTPDDEGKTWEQVQKEMSAEVMASALGGGGTGVRFDLGKLVAYREKTIPGRSETYGQAETRIREDAKKRMKDTLTTDQVPKFEKAIVDPMLGGGFGPATAISFGTVLPAAGMR